MQTRQINELEVVDVHVGGDLHRIVLSGVKPLPGKSVLEQMEFLKERGDGLRKLLLDEPRGGHPSLFADLIVPPSSGQAQAGFIIMEKMGYPLISGTNTMSAAIALIESKRIAVEDGSNTFLLEAPGGLIEIGAVCLENKVKQVTYQAHTPSYLAYRGLSLTLPSFGAVEFDVAWTGAFYPIVDASKLDFKLTREEEPGLVRFSKEFVVEARKAFKPVHPVFGEEGQVSFVVLAGPLLREQGEFTRRVCCYVYPENSVCRCPAGTPSTAVTAQLVEQGRLKLGDSLRALSIFDTDLQITIVDAEKYHGFRGIRVAVAGRGYVTMKSRLIVDFDDPLTPQDGLCDVLEN